MLGEQVHFCWLCLTEVIQQASSCMHADCITFVVCMQAAGVVLTTFFASIGTDSWHQMQTL